MLQNAWWTHLFVFVQYKQNVFPCTSFIYWVFLGRVWSWCQQNCCFCMCKSTPILNHEWSCLCWVGQKHSWPKQHLLSSLFLFCFPLSALDIIAWPSLSTQWEMAALHNTHIVGLCHQQFEWQDALQSAFSLCFAFTSPLLCLSLLSHSISLISVTFPLPRFTHNLCFLFWRRAFYHYFPLGIIAAGAMNSRYASTAGGTSHWWIHNCTDIDVADVQWSRHRCAVHTTPALCSSLTSPIHLLSCHQLCILQPEGSLKARCWISKSPTYVLPLLSFLVIH